MPALNKKCPWTSLCRYIEETFDNWGSTLLANVTVKTFFPRTVAGVQNIIRWGFITFTSLSSYHHHDQECQQYRSEGSSLGHPAHLQPLAVGRGEQRAARHPGVLSYCHVSWCHVVSFCHDAMCHIVRVRTQTTSSPCCLSQSQTDSLITGKLL